MQAAADGSLPSEAETEEYFSPPLPLLPGTLIYAATQPFADSPAMNPPNDEAFLSSWLYYNFLSSLDDFPLSLAGKATQLLNVLYSLVSTWLLLAIAVRLRPQPIHFRTLALGILGMLPLYYKTFAMVLAEPLMFLLVLLGAYWLLPLFDAGGLTWRRAAALGAVAGLGMLTRQWFVSVALVLGLGVAVAAYQQRLDWRRALLAVSSFALVALALALPFYLYLQVNAGSALAFNLEAEDSQAGYDLAYYFTLVDDETFTNPVRNAMGSQFIPILYSETWGDYWAYFVVWGRDLDSGRYVYGLYLDDRLLNAQAAAGEAPTLETNRFEIEGYLGRVNAVSLLPSAILLAGFAWGLVYLSRAARARWADPALVPWALFALIVLVSVSVLLAFLAVYLPQDATMAKASYVLHIFPFLGLFAADLLVRVRARYPRTFAVVVLLLMLVALHNLPMLFSRQVL